MIQLKGTFFKRKKLLKSSGIVYPSDCTPSKKALGDKFSALDIAQLQTHGYRRIRIQRDLYSARSSTADSIFQSQETGPSPFCLPKDAEGSMWTRGSAETIRGLVGQETFGLGSELGNHSLEQDRLRGIRCLPLRSISASVFQHLKVCASKDMSCWSMLEQPCPAIPRPLWGLRLESSPQTGIKPSASSARAGSGSLGFAVGIASPSPSALLC